MKKVIVVYSPHRGTPVADGLVAEYVDNALNEGCTIDLDIPEECEYDAAFSVSSFQVVVELQIRHVKMEIEVVNFLFEEEGKDVVSYGGFGFYKNGATGSLDEASRIVFEAPRFLIQELKLKCFARYYKETGLATPVWALVPGYSI